MYMKNLFSFLILIVVLGGFYLLRIDIQTIDREIRDLELNIDLLYSEVAKEAPKAVTPKTDKKPGSETDEPIADIPGDATVIPTAIIFEAESSPLLSPQTLITITVERVVKKPDGIITIYLKAFTDKANSFSALEVGNLFELVNLSGSNQKPLRVNGKFDSIPPQSSVSGEVIFKIEPAQSTVIFKTDGEEGIKYYRFDFQKKSYEKAILG